MGHQLAPSWGVGCLEPAPPRPACLVVCSGPVRSVPALLHFQLAPDCLRASPTRWVAFLSVGSEPGFAWPSFAGRLFPDRLCCLPVLGGCCSPVWSCGQGNVVGAGQTSMKRVLVSARSAGVRL